MISEVVPLSTRTKIVVRLFRLFVSNENLEMQFQLIIF